MAADWADNGGGRYDLEGMDEPGEHATAAAHAARLRGGRTPVSLTACVEAFLQVGMEGEGGKASSPLSSCLQGSSFTCLLPFCPCITLCGCLPTCFPALCTLYWGVYPLPACPPASLLTR